MEGRRFHEAGKARVLGALAAVACAAALLAAGCSASGDGRAVTVRAADPEVVFAPVVYLHPRERYLPVGVRWFLDRSALWMSYGSACPDGKVAVGRRLEAQRSEVVDWIFVQRLGWGRGYWRNAYADLECDRPRLGQRYHANQLTRPRHESPRRAPALQLDEGYYLDLMDWARGGRPAAERDGQAVVRSRAYYQRRPVEFDDGGDGIRLRYWLLHGMSEVADAERRELAMFAHEGDWERVEVLLRKGENQGEWEPLSVRLADEGGGWRELSWDRVRRERGRGAAAATHPVLHAARGSHTLYARPGGYQRKLETVDGEAIDIVDVAAGPCAQCPRWQTSDQLLQARRRWWYTFGGAWGQPGPTTLTTGPLGPHGTWVPAAPDGQIEHSKRSPRPLPDPYY